MSSWANPVKVGGRLTSSFGKRGTGFHAGQDIAPPSPGEQGVAVYASQAGTVIAAGKNVLAGHSGNGVLIQHDAATKTYYGHLAKIIVKPGDLIAAGQEIGTMGYTGNTIPSGPSGTHLHFGVIHYGKFVDPKTFMSTRGVALGKAVKAQPVAEPPKPSQQTRWIQQALVKMGYRLGVNGLMDDTTKNAIKAYQRDQGLRSDGVWGPVTENHYQYVRRLQGALNRWKAVRPKLVIDGLKGNQTVRALRQVQRANPRIFGKADGVDGPRTRSALGI